MKRRREGVALSPLNVLKKKVKKEKGRNRLSNKPCKKGRDTMQAGKGGGGRKKGEYLHILGQETKKKKRDRLSSPQEKRRGKRRGDLIRRDKKGKERGKKPLFILCLKQDAVKKRNGKREGVLLSLKTRRREWETSLWQGKKEKGDSYLLSIALAKEKE